MKIAIIGTGNVGGALATAFSKSGHHIFLGTKDKNNFKGKTLLANPHTGVFSIGEAVEQSEVILIATPSHIVPEIISDIGAVSGKVIIDATNSVRMSPEPYKTAFHFLMDKTNAELVKCFNTTGYENMLNPVYGDTAIDMFMAGDSDVAKSVARRLALDIGFASCIDFGKSDKVELLEKFALCWINLAIMQGEGRNIAFKLLRR